MRITAGKFKNKNVDTIESSLIRPTLSKIRESIFNVIQNDIENAQWLDMFAGSGIVGIEAASRGAKHITFIEKNPAHYKLLRKNLSNFDFPCKTFLADALKISEKLKGQQFDIIFLDPPYQTNLNEQVLKIIVQNQLLKVSGMVILECNVSEDFVETAKQLNLDIFKEKIYGDTKILYLNQNA